jgi:hypothetical protein
VNNNKPTALPPDADQQNDLQAMLDAMRDARSGLALSNIREMARRNGVADISMNAINQEIRLTRAGRIKQFLQ